MQVNCSFLDKVNGESFLCSYSIPPFSNFLTCFHEYFPFQGEFRYRLQVPCSVLGIGEDIEYIWLDIDSCKYNDEIIDIISKFSSFSIQVSLKDCQQYEEYIPTTFFLDQYSENKAKTSLSATEFDGSKERKEGKVHREFTREPTVDTLNLTSVTKGAANLWKTFTKVTTEKLQSIHTNPISQSISITATESLLELSNSVQTAFDYENTQHQTILKSLWQVLISPLISQDFKFSSVNDLKNDPNWRLAGWQNPTNIVTDLKSSGLLALRSIIYFCRTYETRSISILKANQQNTKLNYPFAIVAVNITLLLIETFSLRTKDFSTSHFASSYEIFSFPNAFFEIFSRCLVCMDESWKSKKADRSQFGAIINEIKSRLHKTLQKGPKTWEEWLVVSKANGFPTFAI